MKDNRITMTKFVKIVERFPILYVNNIPHRTEDYNHAWEKVAEVVRRELKEECTVEEVRCKWKGIRSSFSRFKKKLHLGKNCIKRYYLYDTLEFLQPYLKIKWTPHTNKENSDNDDEWETAFKARSSHETAAVRTYKNNRDSSVNERKASHLGENIEQCASAIKTELPYDEPEVDSIEISGEEGIILLKTESLSKDTNEATYSNVQMTEENLDLQFLKSILPDIAHFTTQEKRKFKMGVLKVIDEIEENRK